MSPRELKPAPHLWRWAGVILAAIAAVYGNSLSGPFVFDGQYAIVSNASVHSLESALAPARNSPVAGRPVVAVTFALNYLAGGLDVRGYHLVNIGIHMAAAPLLFGIVRRTLLMPAVRAHFGARAEALAFTIALMWAVHPLNTEAVDYVTQRTESLMALMLLLTLYASIRAVEAARWARWQSAAVVAAALGMACKESMVVAPVIVVLYDTIFVYDSLGEAGRQRWRLYGALALTWLVLAFLVVTGPRAGSAGFSIGISPWLYLLHQTEMVLRYLRLSFWPTDLVINYGRPVDRTLADVWPQALAVGALLVGTVITLVRWPRAGFLGAWFLLMLAPTSSIIPIATEVGAERRMYLALMAVIACGVLALYRLSLSRRLASPALAIVAIVSVSGALAAATFDRNREYASALTLARTALARWPSPTAHGIVGGELAALGRDDEALPELRAAAAVEPRARYNLGTTLFNLKDYQGAIDELERLARDHPEREEIPAARRAIGSAYALQQRWPEAVAQFRTVLSMVPSDQAARRLLIETLVHYAAALARQERFAEAIAVSRQALDLDGHDLFARHTLAMALYDSGDVAAAVAEAHATLAVDAGHAASHDLIGRGFALQGRYDEAVAELEQAARLSPNDGQIQDDLQQALSVRSESKRTRTAVR